jgi:hypothetical protein
VLIEQGPTDEPGCTIRIDSIEPNRTRAEVEITHERYPHDPLPLSPISLDPFPSSLLLSRSRIHGAARVMGQRVPGGTPPATEEIVSAVRLGLRKRSWPPSGWGLEEVAAATTCLSRHPAPDLNPCRRRSTRVGWGSSSSSSASSWAHAAGYGRGHGHRRVGAMEEVATAATCLSHRPAPDLNPRRCRIARAEWGSSSSSSWPMILLMPPQNCSRSTSSGIQQG